MWLVREQTKRVVGISTIKHGFKKIFAKTGEWGNPIPNPSHCLYNFLSNKKKQFLVAISSNFVKDTIKSQEGLGLIGENNLSYYVYCFI